MSLLLLFKGSAGAYIVNATTPGSYAITGTAATFRYTYKVIPAAGSYAVTGSAATLTRTRLLTATGGSYAITGSDVTFSIHSTAYHLSVDAGSYAVTGIPVTLLRTLRGVAGAGSYALTGTSASFRYTYLASILPGSYEIIGQTVGFRVAALPTPSAILPVFGTWTLPLITEIPVLKVKSQTAEMQASSGFATAPLKVFASASIIPLRVR